SDFLIVTQGEGGALVVTRDGRETVPVCTAEKVMNPTGAGDAFRAGLLYGLERGWNVRDGARLGAVMGSLVVGIDGTLLESLDMEEVWARAEETYGEKLPA
ncbi:carbohydrate kinase family protein, partial [Candidatus Peregrinibacteria bacterium]|nr:carbohydrate kinase family protein [Candidatus Peregrinibacteria bacterium]